MRYAARYEAKAERWGVWDSRSARWAEPTRFAHEPVARQVASELNRREEDAVRWERLRGTRGSR